MAINRWIKAASTTLYGCVYSVAVGYLYVNTLINPTAESSVMNKLTVIGAIALIMACPLLVDRMYRAGRMHSMFRWLMALAHLFTLFILMCSAISWYLFPTNDRWEPLTIILGFTVSWITLLQNGWDEEDQILNVFHFGIGETSNNGRAGDNPSLPAEEMYD